MTDEQFERWQSCVEDAMGYLEALHMGIYPVYLETNQLYSYTVNGGKQSFEVYDIPLSDVILHDEQEFIDLLKQRSNSEEYTIVLRDISPDTDERGLSIVVPKSA